MTKIKGIRQVVRDIRSCPPEWHLEIWSCMSGEDIKVWATEYLTSGSWTSGHPESEKRIDDRIAEVYDASSKAGEREPSITEAIKRTVAIVWGIDISMENEASGIKIIRKSGGALVVTISDLAKALDLEQGDCIDVTIRRRD